jgi:simple sugar transport system permease protein
MLLDRRALPTLSAAAILAAMVVFGALRFDNFATLSNASNVLSDYAYVGIAAVGATFVILSGGIDLSTGSVVAFTGILTAKLAQQGVHPLAALAVGLALGGGFGAAMGILIETFALPAFMVTLAGMFAARASGFLIHDQSLSIKHAFTTWVSRHAVLAGPGHLELPLRSMLFLAVLAAGTAVLARTPFGRNTLALGGAEKPARMMGVPVARTRTAVYAIAGACSALAGWIHAVSRYAGDPSTAVGLELDVIAAVVIGGTLLTGGVGNLLGTFVGVLILGVIRLLIDNAGNLNAAWSRIATAALLLVFIAAQRALSRAGGH